MRNFLSLHGQYISEDIKIRKYYVQCVTTCMLFVLMGWPCASYSLEVTGTNLTEGQWIDSDTVVHIQFDSMPELENTRVFIGNTDLTTLFHSSKRELVYSSHVISLPPGETGIKVYVVDHDEWHEIGTIPIRVRKISGFDRLEFTPKLSVEVKTQLKEGHSPDASVPPRSTYQDFTGQGGIGIEAERGNISAQFQSNLIGTSYRNEALRFAEKGNHAPKVDLSDYLFALNMGSTSLTVGHDQYQGSRYVMPNASNRGMSTSHDFGKQIVVAATVQSTTPVVGYGNILGIKKPDNRIYGVKVSGEVFERPGALKVDVFYSSGSRESNPGFNVGAITDAEKNSNVAMHISASTPESMFSAEIEGARSRFTNPADQSLNQGGDVVPVNTTTDNAWFARIIFNPYQGQFESGKPLSLSISYEFERISPLFKTIGSDVQADSIRHMISANSMVGDIGINASVLEAHDNLDNLTTVLTTKTRSAQLGISVPLGNMMQAQYPEGSLSFLLPGINANYNYSHQFGANRPDLNPLSGFSASHIPDQLTTSIDVSTAWNGDIWHLNYSYQYSRQDNRQTGRQNADFINQLNNISGQIQLIEGLSINAGISRSKSVDIGQAISAYTLSRNIGLNGILFEHWVISGNLETSRISDSLQQANSRSLSANVQLTWQYQLPLLGWKKIPGQAYLRYDRQINDSVDNLFAFRTNVTSWAVLAGFSLSLF